MLANLLPGIRELRAPLAAGYLWIAVAWLVSGRDLPGPSKATGILADLYDIAGWLGKPALLVIASFAAYLLGMLTIPVAHLVLDAIFAWRYLDADGRVNRVRVLLPITARERQFLKEQIRSALELRREVVTAAESENAWLGPRVMSQRGLRVLGRALRGKAGLDRDKLREVFIDLSLASVQLIGKDPDLFNAHDRLRAEAEFRTVVSLPLAALFVALGTTVDARWWFALVIPVAVLVQARNHYAKAGDLLAEAVRAGRLQLTILTEEPRREDVDTVH